jgi:aspartate aminotransferase
MGPPDAIIGLNDSFKSDPNPNKVNVGVGAYRTDAGKPYTLPCVTKASAAIAESKLDNEYLPIGGSAEFVSKALQFAYGDGKVTDNIVGVQTLSGTGGLRVFGEFYAKFGGSKAIYLPSPTWGNHIPIMKNSGLDVRSYRYYDKQNSSLDYDGLIADMEEAEDGSCFLLHACAHNPTGMDPTPAQWQAISDVMKRKKHYPFIDCAYQGFASGDAPTDAAAIRMFVADGHNFALVQSFSKNFGLYGQRVGALSFVASDADEAQRVLSQVKIVIRPSYSNPPLHGARIVETILSDETLTTEFVAECKEMADRITTMRSALVNHLKDAGSTRDWSHVTTQIGMFAYSGLTVDQVDALREKYSIYCTADGRISMAGVTSGNVKYIAEAIHDVTK